MNKSWFTCKVKYQKVDESGSESRVTESYLLDGYTYTEAEARIIHLMNQNISGAFEVTNITKSNYADVIDHDDADLWFRVKVALIIYDDETGKEKHSNQFFLMCANDVQDAFIKTEEYLKGSVSSYVIPAISYTQIVEVFMASESEKQEMELRERGFRSVEEVGE